MGAALISCTPALAQTVGADGLGQSRADLFGGSVQPEKGTHFLDMNYTVFGEVTEGFDVIDKISLAQKDQADRPLKDIKMSVKIVD